MIPEKEFIKFNVGVNKANMYINRRMFFELVSLDGVDVSKTFELSDVVKFYDDGLSDDDYRSLEFKSKDGVYQKHEYNPIVAEDISHIVNNLDNSCVGGTWSGEFDHDGVIVNVERKRIKNLKYVKDNAIVSYAQKDGIPYAIILGYIDKNGMWVGNMNRSNTITVGGGMPHKIDTGLINNISSIFDENSSIVDFGCGNADYVKQLISEGFKCEAYDGNPNTPEMTGGVGKVLDLSQKFDLGKRFDYVMSLEVAEHIPKEYEEVYVDNLIRHTGYYLITSWAVKGQGGDGHVNEQDNEYVLDLYKKKGMTYEEEVSNALRGVANLDWFKETIFVFSK